MLTRSPGVSFTRGVSLPSFTESGIALPRGPYACTLRIVPPNGPTLICASAVESLASEAPDQTTTATTTTSTTRPSVPAMPSHRRRDDPACERPRIRDLPILAMCTA